MTSAMVTHVENTEITKKRKRTSTMVTHVENTEMTKKRKGQVRW